MHAYLRGMCIEILANSDNVLRCGLTPKHVDIPELLRVADFTSVADPRWQPVRAGEGHLVFEVPVPDFRLSVLELHRRGRCGCCRPAARTCCSAATARCGCDAGSGSGRCGAGSRSTSPRETRPARVSGSGPAFVASTNLPSARTGTGTVAGCRPASD